MRKVLISLFVALLCIPAMAQPIRTVLGHPAGGVQDLLMRTVAKEAEASGDKITVENRPGVGSLLAISYVGNLKNRPDTVLLASNTIISGQFFYKKLPFDPQTSFVPVTYLGDTDNILLAHPSVPARTIPQLMKLAKSKEVSFGFGGFASNSYYGVMNMLDHAKVKMLAINNKSSFYVPMDVIRGDIDLVLLPTPSLMASYQFAIKQAKLRIIATTGEARSPLFPTIPTVGETYKGYDSILWWTLFMPADTSSSEAARVKRMVDGHAAMVAKQLSSSGIFIRYKSKAELTSFLANEQKEWERLDKTIKFPRNDY